MKRILVIDDDEQFLAAVTLMLKESDYQVGSAGSGKIALAMLAQNEPWDLVLCDILMPERDGIETILAIRLWNKKQKIIAMSGGGRYLHPQQALEFSKSVGAHEVILKPFTLEQLREVLARLI